MTSKNSERRRATRVSADFPIRLQGEGTAHEGRLRDLSEIGLLCTYPEPIDEMTMVEIGLELPGAERKIQVKGAVVRCDEIAAPTKTHEIAVYFTDTPDASRDALREWVTRSAPAL